MNFAKKMAILIIVFLCVGAFVIVNQIHNSSINVSNSPMKIVIDAGHGTFVLCFKNIEFRKRIRKNEPFLYDLSLFIRTSFHIKMLDNSVPI